MDTSYNCSWGNNQTEVYVGKPDSKSRQQLNDENLPEASTGHRAILCQ